MRARTISGLVAAAATLGVLTTACANSPSGPSSAAASPSAAPTSAIGARGVAVEPMPGAGRLGPGFVDPTAPPPPAGTMTPSPGSWSHALAPEGYRVVLLTTEQDAPTRTLSTAVEKWAGASGIHLIRIVASKPVSYVHSIQKAIDEKGDLIVSVGSGLVDPLALVTASWLDQNFLVLGAELAEPTYNVTAADWKGASFRGEGLGSSSSYDASTFTPERAGRAIRAGVAAVVNGYTGYVIWLT